MAIKLKSIRENKPEALVLVGLPGSGKSTWAWDFKGGYPVLSIDSHIERMAYEKDMEYAQALKTFFPQATQAFKEDVLTFCRAKQSFIWDQSNLTREGRELIYKMLSPTHKVTYVCFFVPVEECIRRIERRVAAGGVPIDPVLIRKLAYRCEFPSSKSGEKYDRIVQLKHPAWGAHGKAA